MDLLPCPFCGVMPTKPVNETPTKRPTWRIVCNHFCISMARDTKSKVIKDWNTRVTP